MTHRLLRQKIAAERDRARASEAMGLFDFALERRDTLEGQPVIVVSFKPKPNAQPRSREGRIAASFVGFAWVHEHEYQVMRVEAEAITDTSFGFGVIAKLHRGAKALVYASAIRRRMAAGRDTHHGHGQSAWSFAK